MRFSKVRPPTATHRNHPFRGNQRSLQLLLLCAVVAGCSANINNPFGTPKNFSGMVAADEPQAALVGRDVLAGGGNAADAAVAMAFTLTVTLPSQASLGAAGSCLAYDHGQKTVEAIDFVPSGIAAGGAVPGLPRGLFLLHARHGKKRWDSVLAPAVGIAQRGIPASRAFIRQFAPVASRVLADPNAAAIFVRSDGQPLAEGDTLSNPPLGVALGRMASRGVGEFYGGGWGREFTTAAARAGGTFDFAALSGFVPQSHDALKVEYGHEFAFFAPPPAQLGTPESAAWTELADTYDGARAADRPRVVAEALAKTGVRSSAADSGTGLVAVDGDGSAVVCALTLNAPFGTGRIVPEFGAYLAAPAPGGAVALGPMLTINPNSDEFRFGGTASGGVSGTQAMLQVAAAVLLGDQTFPDEMAALSQGAGAEVPGRVEAARCISGSPDIGRCIAATDPRGFGLAQTLPGH